MNYHAIEFTPEDYEEIKKTGYAHVRHYCASDSRSNVAVNALLDENKNWVGYECTECGYQIFSENENGDPVMAKTAHLGMYSHIMTHRNNGASGGRTH